MAPSAERLRVCPASNQVAFPAFPLSRLSGTTGGRPRLGKVKLLGHDDTGGLVATLPPRRQPRVVPPHRIAAHHHRVRPRSRLKHHLHRTTARRLNQVQTAPRCRHSTFVRQPLATQKLLAPAPWWLATHLSSPHVLCSMCSARRQPRQGARLPGDGAADPGGVPRAGGDLAVQRHGVLQDAERPHEFGPMQQRLQSAQHAECVPHRAPHSRRAVRKQLRECTPPSRLPSCSGCVSTFQTQGLPFSISPDERQASKL